MSESKGVPRMRVAETLAVVAIWVLFLILLAQIVLRTFGVAFVWVEEFSITMFTWIVFLGAAIAFRRGEHPAVELGYEFLRARLSPGAMVAVDWLLHVIAAVFLLVTSIGMWAMMRQTWPLYSGMIPGFRVGFLYLGVFLCTLRGLIAVIQHGFEQQRALREGKIYRPAVENKPI